MDIRKLANCTGGAILLLFGVIKLISSLGSETLLLQPEPVTGLSLRYFLMFAGLFEIGAGAWVVFSSQGLESVKKSLLAGFCFAFIAYRLLLWKSGFHGWCPCLGSLAQWFPWLSTHMKGLSDSALVLLLVALIVSLFFQSAKSKEGGQHQKTKLPQTVLCLLLLLLSAQVYASDGVRIEGKMVKKIYRDGKSVASYISPFTLEWNGSKLLIEQTASEDQGGFLRSELFCDGKVITSLQVIPVTPSKNSQVSNKNQSMVVTNHIDIHYGSEPTPNIWKSRFLWFVLADTNRSDMAVKSNLCLIKYDQDTEYFIKNYTIDSVQSPDGKMMWALNSDGTIPIGGTNHLSIGGPFPSMIIKMASETVTGEVAKVSQLTRGAGDGAPVITWTLEVIVDLVSSLEPDTVVGFIFPPGEAIVNDYRILADGEPTSYLSKGKLIAPTSQDIKDIRNDILRGRHRLGLHWGNALLILAVLFLPLLFWIGITKRKQNKQ